MYSQCKCTRVKAVPVAGYKEVHVGDFGHVLGREEDLERGVWVHNNCVRVKPAVHIIRSSINKNSKK